MSTFSLFLLIFFTLPPLLLLSPAISSFVLQWFPVKKRFTFDTPILCSWPDPEWTSGSITHSTNIPYTHSRKVQVNMDDAAVGGVVSVSAEGRVAHQKFVHEHSQSPSVHGFIVVLQRGRIWTRGGGSRSWQQRRHLQARCDEREHGQGTERPPLQTPLQTYR